MSLIYITGAPGSGKTTIQKELIKLGYDARDIDDQSFGGPHNKATGELVTIPPADLRPSDWFDAHEWRLYPVAFKKLKAESLKKDIIVCGVAESDVEILPLFDKVLYLALSNNVLIDRLGVRTDNDYGKNDFEIKEILERKYKLDKRYRAPLALEIDAARPLNEVVNEIISNLSTK